MNPFKDLLNLFKGTKKENIARESNTIEDTLELLETLALKEKAQQAEQEERWLEAADTWNTLLSKGGQAYGISDNDVRAKILARRAQALAHGALDKAAVSTERALKAMEQGHWQEAIEAWSIIVEAGEALPDHIRAEALNGRGQAFSFAKHYKQAHDDFENALSIEPDNASFWGSKAVVLFVEEKYQQAFEAAKQATKLDPNDENAKLVLTRLKFTPLSRSESPSN